MLEEIILALQNFYAAHPYGCHIIGFILLCIIDGELPEDSKYKLLTKGLTFLGNMLNKDIREYFTNQVEEVNKNITELYDKIDEETKSRKEDSIASMRHDITAIYHQSQEQGYILEMDKENYNDLYERYTENGGNSYVEKDINPYINSLPRFLSHDAAQEHYRKKSTYNNGTEEK